MSQYSNLTIIIPARNEAPTIGGIIDAAKKYSSDIIVSDGNSKDETREVAVRHGARVVKDNGKGKGDGIRVALPEAHGDIIVFMDADGSHDHKDIPALVEPIIRNEADLVMGSRMLGGSDELHSNLGELTRLLGSNIITGVINFRFGKSLTDYQNGFRAIRKSTIESLGLQENHTTIEQEMSIKCLKRGFAVSEVPTHEYRRKFGKSNISLVRHSARYVYSVIKYALF